MEILNDYMINSGIQDFITLILCFLIASFTTAIIFFVVAYFGIENGITVKRLIGGGAICLCLLGISVYGLLSIKPSLHRIDVIFTEDVSITELSEKFKFIDQKGRIYTLQYKED